jgi:hypothetical protein
MTANELALRSVEALGEGGGARSRPSTLQGEPAQGSGGGVRVARM